MNKRDLQREVRKFIVRNWGECPKFFRDNVVNDEVWKAYYVIFVYNSPRGN